MLAAFWRRRIGRRFTGSGGETGVSLVELVCVSTIIVVMATVAIPVVGTIQRRHKELALRNSLRLLRTAIDDYRRVVGENPALNSGTNPDVRPECEGYPCELEILVSGVDTREAKERKIKFLRRIPVDPFTGKREWGVRSAKQEPDAASWDHLHVFDVYSLSDAGDSDGTAYKMW
jgi:general secretion pathway protein G